MEAKMTNFHKFKSLRFIVFAMIVTIFVSLLTPIGVSADGSLSLSDKGYKLKQVVVLSRHNIRAPMSTKGSTLELVTPYEWNNWSSNASELSLRGGVLETEMGQYFKKWLESEGLIPENYHPANNEVRFYANSRQRTIATANFFSAGMLPTADVEIEYHGEFNSTDPTFTPAFNFVSDEYIKDATAQTHELFDAKVNDLADNYELIADVIDMDKSETYGDYVFNTEYGLNYVVGQEPTTDGSLKLGTSISDALVLQYYEESDAVKAGFGNDLSFEQWKAISEIKDVYGDVLFTAPMVATNVAKPLIEEIYSELNTDGRIFTFLCGHDANIGSVLAALGVKDYELPDAIESKTPIGCKVVFSKWESKKGKIYWSVDLVYQSVDQLRTQPILDLDNEPIVYHLSFNGIKQNKDGLYKAKAIKKIFNNSLKKYDALYEKYFAGAED